MSPDRVTPCLWGLWQCQGREILSPEMWHRRRGREALAGPAREALARPWASDTFFAGGIGFRLPQLSSLSSMATRRGFIFLVTAWQPEVI